jgi:hypothetical protein
MSNGPLPLIWTMVRPFERVVMLFARGNGSRRAARAARFRLVAQTDIEHPGHRHCSSCVCQCAILYPAGARSDHERPFCLIALEHGDFRALGKDGGASPHLMSVGR